MRSFGGSRGQAIGALWRGMLLLLVLVASAAHTEPSYGLLPAPTGPDLHIAQPITAPPEMHPEGACSGAGHCAPAFASIAQVLTIVQVSQGRIIFVWPKATTAQGRSVDPGQHPPKALAAV